VRLKIPRQHFDNFLLGLARGFELCEKAIGVDKMAELRRDTPENQQNKGDDYDD